MVEIYTVIKRNNYNNAIEFRGTYLNKNVAFHKIKTDKSFATKNDSSSSDSYEWKIIPSEILDLTEELEKYLNFRKLEIRAKDPNYFEREKEVIIFDFGMPWTISDETWKITTENQYRERLEAIGMRYETIKPEIKVFIFDILKLPQDLLLVWDHQKKIDIRLLYQIAKKYFEEVNLPWMEKMIKRS